MKNTSVFLLKIFSFSSILLLTLLHQHIASAQGSQKNYWKSLEDVSYSERKDINSGFTISYPVFGEQVIRLEGNQILLKGFMVPLDELTGKNRFVLSSLPFNICFFCGGAGPETVIEVHSKEQIGFTDDAIWIKGRFFTNGSNPEELMYILKEAEIVDK